MKKLLKDYQKKYGYIPSYNELIDDARMAHHTNNLVIFIICKMPILFADIS